MKFAHSTRGYILKLESGEEILESLVAFIEKNRIPSGYFQVIGGVTDVELGYFDLKKNDYDRHTYDGDYELITASGNISDVEGKPFVHTHAVFSDEKFRTFSGHLFKAIVTITVEIFLFPLDIALIRRPNETINYRELDLPHHFVK